MSRPNLVVVGDVLLDREVVGSTTRLCPDAPAPVIDVERVDEGPGGAGLAAVLGAGADVDVTLIAPVADDAAGERVRAGLAAAGVDLVALGHEGATRTKCRIRIGHQVVARLDEGGPAAPLGRLPRRALEALEAADGILVSCYGAGTTRMEPLREVLADKAGQVPVIWDPHPRGAPPIAGCAVATPNAAEAAEAVAASGRSVARPPDVAAELVQRWRSTAVSVTVGAEGVWLARSDGDVLRIPAPECHDGDTCGAGDRYASTVAVALTRGQHLSDAIRLGVAEASAWVAAGGVSAHRVGSAAAADRPDGGSPRRRDPDVVTRLGEAAAMGLAREVHARGGALIATGGCFDVLHAGHVQSLRAARALGDALVVLLNSDASVRRLKGRSRPVQTERDRAQVLLALDAVDAVVIFDEDEPSAVLDRIRPDVWAKGADYAGAVLPEADLVRSWGGRVQILPLLPGRSTTAILKDAG
ncbi:PfkB family carbohydrate kinase [Intrasporangium sp.]|uniref:PfkB family carbohydrate kinase n=1 Tax=Intrasporangium sp. TaxID=1925024 RepID=UPI00336597D3